MPSTFAEFASDHKEQLTETLNIFFKEKKAESEALSPILQHSTETLEKFVLHGGKRVRSLLVVLGYLLAGGKMSERESVDGESFTSIYKVAAAIELVHKHLLVLDDIADKDELRNGQPTVWTKYVSEFKERGWKGVEHHGRTFAELDSALLGSYVTEMIHSSKDQFSAEKLLTVLHLIDKQMYAETLAGWQIQYELNHVALHEATEAEFMKGLELVTARYTFVAPLMIGISLAEETPELKKALTQYGVSVGTAFQIQDDILGLFGDPKETGKPVGNDVREGKKTLLLQKAFELAHPVDKEFLEDVCGRDLFGDELTRVQHIVKNSGALEYSNRLADDCINEGIGALKGLDQESAEVKVLIDLANYVVKRNV